MPNSINLQKGVEGLFIKNTRFKTARVSFNFYLPLSADTVSVNALLPCLLTSCSEKYPNYIDLNRKLKDLYGAVLSQSSQKIDDMQCVSIAVTALCDKYTPDNEPLVLKAATLLAEIIFSPRICDEEFLSEDVLRERRQLAEHIESEINDKRLYARNRMIEKMYDGLPYGLARYGSADKVRNVSGADLFKAWQNMLRTAFVRVCAIGDFCPDKLFSATAEAFSKISRDNVTKIVPATGTASRASVQRVEEKLEVAQGKLVMGFDSKVYGSDPESDSLIVMADIFGGGPYSLLFENVREKQSLCYYCSCNSVRNKGMLMVDSGVEAANAKKAEAEILAQLENMKQGKIDDKVFSASICGLVDSVRSYNDSLNMLDAWYTIRIGERNPIAPTELVDRIKKVSKEDVINAAKGVSLNTVYTLLPEEKA